MRKVCELIHDDDEYVFRGIIYVTELSDLTRMKIALRILLKSVANGSVRSARRGWILSGHLKKMKRLERFELAEFTSENFQL